MNVHKNTCHPESGSKWQRNCGKFDLPTAAVMAAAVLLKAEAKEKPDENAPRDIGYEQEKNGFLLVREIFQNCFH